MEWRDAVELSEVWVGYCEKRIPAVVRPGSQSLSPEEVLEAFWTFHPLFRGRMDAIKATPFSAAFDTEADNALLNMAETDSFELWEGISAGAWRVLYERFLYCSTVVSLGMALGEKVTGHLPSGLAPQSQARALLLRYLLGEGRAIDRRLLPRSAPGTAPLFPASAPIRRQ